MGARQLSKIAFARARRQAAGHRLRTRRNITTAATKGKVILKRVGNRKAFHVDGQRKKGIHRFLATRVLTKHSTTLRNTTGFTPLCTTPVEVVGSAVASANDNKLSSYQKTLRGQRRGLYLHKQVGRSIKAAADAKAKRLGKPGGKRGLLTRKVDLHPMLKTAYRLLDRCGYVPLAADVGVHFKRYATEIDLVCYAKGGSKTDVIPVEIKTGFEDERDYTRPRYRLRLGTGLDNVKSSRASSKILCSKQDYAFLQLLASVILCSASQPKWTIKDALLLNIRPSRSELRRIPDSILRLRPALEAKLQSV